MLIRLLFQPESFGGFIWSFNITEMLPCTPCWALLNHEHTQNWSAFSLSFLIPFCFSLWLFRLFYLFFTHRCKSDFTIQAATCSLHTTVVSLIFFMSEAEIAVQLALNIWLHWRWRNEILLTWMPLNMGPHTVTCAKRQKGEHSRHDWPFAVWATH